MKNINFLSYNLNEELKIEDLQQIKNNFKQEIYIDRFDNFFNKSASEIHKSFSNLAIGYVFNAVNNSKNFLLIKQKNEIFTKNKFNWLELIVARQKHDKIFLVNKQQFENSSNIDSLLKNSPAFETRYILDAFKKEHTEKTDDSIFVVYNRDKNLINVDSLAKFKNNSANKTYIDCLDNDFAVQSPSAYSAFNKDCRFSPDIFDFVFSHIIKSRDFCVIETPEVYANQFTKMQILFAHYLGKQIKVIKEEDVKKVLDCPNSNLNDYMQNCNLKQMLNNYDLKTANINASAIFGREQ